MGLDTVELVMALEEEFGIEISDADAAHMMTPRHVIDYIARLLHSGQGRCTSRAGFYQFRRACINALGVQRRQVRPDTQLTTLLPATGTREAWARLGESMAMPDHYWPALRYSDKIMNLWRLAFIFTVISFTGLAACFGWVVGLLGFLFSLRLALWIDDRCEHALSHHRIHLPSHLVVVSDLIDALIPKDWIKAQAAINRWDRDRIAKKVKEIIIEQLGIDEKQYHEDARFIEDFGAD